ncbi:hypothetical protein [Phenylobacterium sp.]|uniref:hypothetical protein n=1 Tax=Phenylobacterium sp. TaxID=1871053 RepID=UPI0012086371|nr:hypothetical protein [Phenylobacterium sp.]THD64177.1 MAG: hypothetical protein E8A12_08200 [Phenylobacterium sp.]
MPKPERRSMTAASPDGRDLLAAWTCDGKPPQDAMAQVATHPRFASAVVALARSAVEITASRANTAHASVDAGRYVAKLAAMWLDARDELTLPALKRLCAASGLLSPGRARVPGLS